MLDFLRRYQVPISSGALLLLATMLVSANAGGGRRTDPLGRIVLEAIYPFQLAVTGTTVEVARVWNGYLSLVGAREEADGLKERVRTLEGELTRFAEVQEANRRLRRLLKFRRTLDTPVVAARVISWDAAGGHTITLDKGERDGVIKGAAVIVPEGVVGRVFQASAHAARVLLVSDRNSGVDAIVQRTRVHGIVQGRDNGCELKYVKRGSDVEVGDNVVTSGLDNIFPKGVLIGDVVQVARREQGLFQNIAIEPRVAFDRLEEVLVTTGAPSGESVG
jgi:rod shape-determining protein MreC